MPRRIFCEERIVIAFVIPRKPLSKKKIQYQHEYHEYNIGDCEYSQILPSQIPVFFCNIFETYQACHGCNQSAESSLRMRRSSAEALSFIFPNLSTVIRMLCTCILPEVCRWKYGRKSSKITE